MAMTAKELEEITEAIARDPKVSATARVRALEILARRQTGATSNGRVPKRDTEAKDYDPLEGMDDELAAKRAQRGS